MPGTYGERSFMEKLLEIELEVGGKIEDPIPTLIQKANLCEVSIRKYIVSLDARGHIRYTKGNRGARAQIEILRNDLGDLEDIAPVVKATIKLPMLSPAPAPPPPPTPPVPTPTPEKPIAALPLPDESTKPKMRRVAIFLDYDNLAIGGAQQGICVSWHILKERARKFGRVVVSDAYLSPSGTNPGVIRRLVNDGFRPVYCPLRYKDKDGVDFSMTADARKYITEDWADTVIIASRDSDFQGLRDFAEDAHKSVVFFGVEDARPTPTTIPAVVATAPPPSNGIQDPPPLEDDRETDILMRALDCVGRNQVKNEYAGPKHIGFMRSVLAASSRVTILGLGNLEEFEKKVWEGVGENWGRMFTPSQTKSAIKVLRSRGLILIQNNRIIFDENHAIARMVLD